MKKKVMCWNCGKSSHVRRNCPIGGAESANCSEVDNATLLVEGGDDVL